MQWIFDPIPPSGARRKGVPSLYVLNPDLDTFVREALQNSKDQHDEDRAGEPVIVRFVLQRLSGESKETFLESIDWPSLKSHVAASAHSGTPSLKPMRRALDEIDSQPLINLLIEDSATYGLTGGEDEQGKNFNALCRNVLDTTEDRPQRGGSYGLGKAVLWRFSDFSTVLFSSRIAGNPQPGFRFFGHAQLPDHDTSSGEWAGSGWFGKRQKMQHGERAVSLWNIEAEKIAKSLAVFREPRLGTGTSILIVGFRQPLEDEPAELTKIADAMLRSATRWFWPSICGAQPSLQVSVEVNDNGKKTFFGTAELTEEIRPFVECLLAKDFTQFAAQPNQITKSDLLFTVPEKESSDRMPADPESEATGSLIVTRYSASDAIQPLSNTIALTRGSGMVVQYLAPGRKPVDDVPFFAVFRAGLAHGKEATDIAFESFLRAAEPPSHNQWIVTQRIQAEYKRGARTRLESLWKRMAAALLDLCKEQQSKTDEGPALLRRLFPVKGKGGGISEPAKFHVTRLEAAINGNEWTFSGRVSVDPDNQKDWKFTVALWLDSETGKGDRLPIENVKAAGGQVQVLDDHALCHVDALTKTIEFQGSTKQLNKALKDVDYWRARVRLEVRPSLQV